MTQRVPVVVVVGAGPVGVTAASLLARYGVESVVLERHAAPYPLPRAVHLDDEAVRILQAVGVAERFAEVSRAMPGLRLVDAGLNIMAEFHRGARPGRHGHPCANMFDQPDLERILLANLAGQAAATLRRGCEVTSVTPVPGAVLVRYTDTASGGEHQLLADAVLGCDGANSLVRAAIGARWRDLRFRERWLVIDVRTPRPLDVWSGVHQICDPARPATFMHIARDRYRWEFRLADGETAEQLCTPARLATLLAPLAGEIPVDELEVVRHATYTFRARVADPWRRDRIFLLGDAAHQTPPFVGQGLGAGLRDAHNLAWKLAQVLHGTAPEAILASYQAERRPQVTRVVRAAIAVGWALNGGGRGATTVVRRVLLTGLGRLPGLDRLAPRSGPAGLTRGTLTAGGRLRLSGLGLVGRPCPQPTVQVAGETHRFDDVLGEGWALLALGPADRATGALVDGFQLRHVDVGALRYSDGDQPDLAGWLRRRRAVAALVRPDRVVFGAARHTTDIPTLVATSPVPMALTSTSLTS